MTPTFIRRVRSSAITPAIALTIFVACTWLANRSICSACRTSEVRLLDSIGSSYHAQMFWPDKIKDEGAGLPAVVVSPGYMANARYMNVPWAEDITRMGAVALIVDRRGQGRSEGSLWPYIPPGTDIGDSAPALRSAIEYLRSLTPAIDPARIALLGHSDGATAALIAGSADWEIRSTIAVSPSTGPWQFVNHVVPQNMMLVFGADDHFILHDTDTALISRATRFDLVGEGSVGDPRVGDARRLVRVPGAGHLDVLVSATTRAAVHRWLRDALALPNGASPESGSGSRSHWLTFGVIALAGALTYRPGAIQPQPSEHLTRPRLVGMASIAAAWAAGLIVFASPLERRLHLLVPAQETAVFVTSIWSAGAALAFLALAAWVFRRRFDSNDNLPVRPHVAPASIVRGLAAAGSLLIALKLLLWHHYEVSPTLSRSVVFLTLSALILPGIVLVVGSLISICASMGRVGHDVDTLISRSLGLGALITALLTPWLFARMTMAGGYLTAAGFAATAIYHSGLAAGRAADSVIFGSALIASVASMACALY